MLGQDSARSAHDTRWDCHSCGACCRFGELGPVENGIIEGLQQKKIDQEWAPASDGWFEWRDNPDGSRQAYLKRVNGGCVFLKPDNRCAVHALHGAAAKPGFCRAFPFHVVEDPHGTVVVVREECDGLQRSATTGTPVQDQIADVLALPRPGAPHRFAPTQVELIPGAAVDLESWMVVEERILARLTEQATDPLKTMVDLREMLFGLVGRTAPEPNPEQFHKALGAVLYAIGHMARLASESDDAVDPTRIALVTDMADQLQLALHYNSATAIAPLTDDAVGYANQVLMHAVLGKRWAAIGSVPAGLGANLVATTFARLVAERDADDRVNAVALGDVVSPWSRFTLNHAVQDMLRRASPALVDVFLHATA